MKELFRTLRNISTTTILIILINCFGLRNWHTWVIYLLVYVSMLFDYLYTIEGGYDD